MKKIFSWRHLIAITLLTGTLIAVNLFGFSNNIKNFFYSFSSPASKFFWSAGDEISDFLAGFLKAKGLKEEAERISVENQNFFSQIVKLSDARKENEELRKALGLNLDEGYELELANIVGKDVSRDSILIDKGRGNGFLSRGMPVINSEKVVVGRIGEVFNSFSEVVLITNKDSSFDSKMFDKEVYGLIKGKGSLNLAMEMIPKEKDILIGDLVITSNLGGVFPGGFLVGRVSEVTKSDVATFQTAEIEPYFKVNELKTLFVIKDYMR